MNVLRASALGMAAMLTMPSATFAQASAEARMRDQLRQTVTQLRQLQDENAQLQAQVAALQQAVDAREVESVGASTQETARLQGELKSEGARADELDRRLGQLTQALAQWKQGYEQAATAYRTRDADAKRLEAQLEQTTVHAKTCDANNAALVGIADELISRYKDKTLGDWMADREPLSQLGRVKFESLAQEYHAKVTDLAVPPLEQGAPAALAMP